MEGTAFRWGRQGFFNSETRDSVIAALPFAHVLQSAQPLINKNSLKITVAQHPGNDAQRVEVTAQLAVPAFEHQLCLTLEL
jgi:hypothetical protein